MHGGSLFDFADVLECDGDSLDQLETLFNVGILSTTKDDREDDKEDGESGNVSEVSTLPPYKEWLKTKENFADGFNYLISTGEIQGKQISSLNDIPEWIITFLGEKWYDEEISDAVYYQALEYLQAHKIIQ